MQSLPSASAAFLSEHAAFEAQCEANAKTGAFPTDNALRAAVETMRAAIPAEIAAPLAVAALAYVQLWDSLETDGPFDAGPYVTAIRAALDSELATMTAADLNSWYADIVGYRPQQDLPSMPDSTLRALCLGYLAESCDYPLI